MIQITVLFCIMIIIFILLYYRLVQVDLTFPWFLSLIILGFVGINHDLVVKLASFFQIYNEPLVIVFLTFFILFGLVTVLLIGYTNLRLKQIQLVRKIAEIELMNQSFFKKNK
ncbi:DUF2304 family protein [Pelagibacterales bacterium SAG-MED32]|nr:DUF2304 family protein [Pelagibacterales bacterium SAG-MED32]